MKLKSAYSSDDKPPIYPMIEGNFRVDDCFNYGSGMAVMDVLSGDVHEKQVCAGMQILSCCFR